MSQVNVYVAPASLTSLATRSLYTDFDVPRIHIPTTTPIADLSPSHFFYINVPRTK